MAMPQWLQRQIQHEQRQQQQAEMERRRDEGVVLIMAHMVQQRRRQRRRRSCWVRPWIERRHLFGQYETLFHELERESRGDFHSYMRMDKETFAEILQRVEPRIVKTEK